MKLKGKVALVTGGTGFLGSMMCEALHEEGARVIAVSRGKSAQFIEKSELDNLLIVKRDLSDEVGVNSLIDLLADRHDKIDVLVNNSHEWSLEADFMKTSWEVLERTLTSGLVSQLYLTKRVMQEFMMAADMPGASIINVGSMYGRVAPDHRIYRESGRGNAIEYGACKAGLIQATKYIASIGGKYGIRCNSISPGPFPRPGTFDNGFEWFQKELSDRTMLGRVGKPQELKGVITFLASDMSSYVTGVDIPVDGGWTAW